MICIACVMLVTGCGGSNIKSDLPDTPEKNTESAETDEKNEADTKAKEAAEEKDKTVDLTSEKSITSYLAGDWTLLDRDTGKDYGTFSIRNDGSFEFTRLSDKASGSGKLSFEYGLAEKGDEPDQFILDFSDCRELVPDDLELYGNEGTSGIFHIGTFGNKDYLYLKEIGNGDSIVSVYVFNTRGKSDDIGDWSYDWLFYRKNDTENPADMIKDDTVYAWAWETDEDGVWLQPMTDHEYEAHEEYTDRKYLGGYFNEKDNIGIAHYGITKSTDFSGLVNTRDWNSGYPLMMCEVTVDGDCNVTKLRDIDIVMYSSYDMGEIEPDFYCKDMAFVIDGYEINITKTNAPNATRLVDAQRVGDWIMVECYDDPDTNTYLFYNIYDGLVEYFEYQIDGANLIWQGDDLSTAVYRQHNTIYDFWGHQIGYMDEGELYELSFKDKNTIAAKCWIVDAAGREKEFTKEFEYEPCDGAVWAYYEYMLGGGRQWRRFKDMAGDAEALIIVNPPEKILSRLSYLVEFAEGALDKVVVVPLADDASVTIESTVPGSLPGDKKQEDTEEIEKGRAVVFDVTVPEGMPTAIITVKSSGRVEAAWDVMQLSGRIPQMSTFIK